MNRSRAPAFHSANQLLAPGCEVLIVAPISRTWYKDRATLTELCMWLEEQGASPTVFAHSAVGLGVDAVNEALGSEVPFVDDVKMPATQPDHLFASATLVIALVARQSKDVTTASPHMKLAVEYDVPVLALFDNDDAAFYPPAAMAEAL